VQVGGVSGPLEHAVRRVVEGEVLDDATMEGAVAQVLAGNASDAQLAAFAVALRMRGETPTELAAAARVLRRHATPFAAPEGLSPLVDTCGTGGDGADTFNISTGAGLILAALGVPVVKHGNRAVSSRSGSADVLEALGAELDPAPELLLEGLRTYRFAFFYAPAFHGAVRYAGPVRRELGLRTLFNVLGPLSNPGGATHQLLGVYDGALVAPLAEVLGRLGLTGAWVVHGEGGLDELTVDGATRVAALADGRVRTFTVTPEDFGLPRHPLAELAGGDAATNAAILRAVFRNEERGAPRTALVLNAAAALMASGQADAPMEAARRVAEALDDGRVAAHVDALLAFTRGGG
jgi:anthranilate phosphoribosyltransferase